MSNNFDREAMLAHLKNINDEQAMQNACADKDAQPMSIAALCNPTKLENNSELSLLERFKNAQLKETKTALTVRYDADIVRWYKSHGKGYQSLMNAALRACMEDPCSPK